MVHPPFLKINFGFFTRFFAFCIVFTELIGAEGARSSKMHSHFLRAVFTQGAYSMPAGVAGQVRPRRRGAPRRLTARPAVR
ncbi:hypothetical protein BK139_14900 [Paenibacillus sp. FSL R5-0490]|nr:hypothetical protein BK139_14900 [Paenibacillus sp. FSL R5-0490]